jgi:hypothetical protein
VWRFTRGYASCSSIGASSCWFRFSERLPRKTVAVHRNVTEVTVDDVVGVDVRERIGESLRELIRAVHFYMQSHFPILFAGRLFCK